MNKSKSRSIIREKSEEDYMKIGDMVVCIDSKNVGVVVKKNHYYPDDSDMIVPIAQVLWCDDSSLRWSEVEGLRKLEDEDELYERDQRNRTY